MSTIQKGLITRKQNSLENGKLVQQIKDILHKEKITHSELALHLGISKQAMSFYLNDTRGYMFPATFYIKMIKYIRSKRI